jgi:hypothetical protein
MNLKMNIMTFMNPGTTFYYFGYASNLDEETLLSRVHSGWKPRGLAALREYGFRFDFLNPDGSARANLLKSPNETVYGMLYEMDQEALTHFLQSEPGYDWVEVSVLQRNEEIKAMTFISSSRKTAIYPKPEYLEVILRGGRKNGLPETYLSLILNRAGSMMY